MSWIILYDEDKVGFSAAFRQVNRRHKIPAERIIRSGNRIELMRQIMEQTERGVALIDLESNELSDHQYSGHRIIETIRRHPELRKRCRPIAFTQHARPDVIELARRHAAVALISKLTLDRLDEAETLEDFLERQLTRPLSGTRDDFEVFPRTALDASRAASYQLRDEAAMGRVLVRRPRLAETPWFWDVIRHLAQGLDPQSVAIYVAYDYGAKLNTVNQYISELADSMSAEFRVRRTRWTEFAQELLRDLPHHRIAPNDELLFRAMHRLYALEGVVSDDELREASFLDADALAALDRLWGPDVERSPVDDIRGNVRDEVHKQKLEALFDDVAVDPEDRVALQAGFVRAVYNLFDTHLAAKDLRDRERQAEEQDA